jgi:hypothetical protein
MRLAELTREGQPAFPPAWQDPLTGAEPLREQPLAGIVVGVEWGPHDLSLILTNYWRGRRLTGRLLLDNARLLPAVHALLVGSIPRHVDELATAELPGTGTEPPAAPRRPGAPAIVRPEPVPAPPPPVTPPPDLAVVVQALVRKGVLSQADLDAARRELDGTADRDTGPPPGARPA